MTRKAVVVADSSVVGGAAISWRGGSGAADGRRISLGRSGLWAIVDDADYEMVNSVRWTPCYSHGLTYARQSRHRGKKIFMHRFILGAAVPHIVDHQNGDGLDNRRSNLRSCSTAQNQWNGGKKHPNGLPKGVHLTPNGRFRAQICFAKKLYHLGNFHSSIDAGLAYDRAAKEMFGEFARLNFPGGLP